MSISLLYQTDRYEPGEVLFIFRRRMGHSCPSLFGTLDGQECPSYDDTKQ